MISLLNVERARWRVELDCDERARDNRESVSRARVESEKRGECAGRAAIDVDDDISARELRDVVRGVCVCVV